MVNEITNLEIHDRLLNADRFLSIFPFISSYIAMFYQEPQIFYNLKKIIVMVTNIKFIFIILSKDQ